MKTALSLTLKGYTISCTTILPRVQRMVLFLRVDHLGVVFSFLASLYSSVACERYRIHLEQLRIFSNFFPRAQQDRKENYSHFSTLLNLFLIEFLILIFVPFLLG